MHGTKKVRYLRVNMSYILKVVHMDMYILGYFLFCFCCICSRSLKEDEVALLDFLSNFSNSQAIMKYWPFLFPVLHSDHGVKAHGDGRLLTVALI